MNETMMPLEEFNQLPKQEQHNILVDYVDRYGKKEIKDKWRVSAQWINNRLYPLDLTITKTKNEKTKTRTSKRQGKSNNRNKRKTSLKNKETELNLESTKLNGIKDILNDEPLKEESMEIETIKNVKIENCGFEVQLSGLMSTGEVQERLHKIADALLSSKEYNIMLNLKEV